MLKNTEEKDLFSYSLIQAHEISVVNFLFTEKISVVNSFLSLFEPMHDMSHSFGAMQRRNLRVRARKSQLMLTKGAKIYLCEQDHVTMLKEQRQEGIFAIPRQPWIII